MNVAAKLIQILEENHVEHIFGLPGEQILPFYNELANSKIKHILVRHEQSAAHAADAYRRSSNKLGVCMATASSGALNLVMGVATAFKDHVPILVITGDNPTTNKYSDEFQSFPLSDVFSKITFRSYDPQTGSEAIANLIEIMQIFQREPNGPIHLNLSKNILLEDDYKIPQVNYEPIYHYGDIEKAYQKIKNSKKPLLILGSGARDSKIEKLAIENNIPTCTTFPAKGIISEYEKNSLGLIGNRSNNQGKYALKHSDCVIAVGTRLSERTLKEDISDKLIHVNIDKNVLKGDLAIHMDCKVFAEELEFPNALNFLEEILNINPEDEVDEINDKSQPLRPPSVINSILKSSKDAIIVSDAGSHTTWTTLLTKCSFPGQLLFSGGLAPMGYGLPAAIGASIATDKSTVLINGDGDIQMNIHELATLKEYDLAVCVCILNNSSYYAIKQTQKNLYNEEPFEVDLNNPDFIKIAEAYSIPAKKVTSKEDLEETVNEAINLRKPYLIEIIVKEEDIPLTKLQ